MAKKLRFKMSTYMMRGWNKVKRKCNGKLFSGLNGKNPRAVCALGAVGLAAYGDASKGGKNFMKQHKKFEDKYYMPIVDANDFNMNSIPQIARMLKAIG